MPCGSHALSLSIRSIVHMYADRTLAVGQAIKYGTLCPIGDALVRVRSFQVPGLSEFGIPSPSL